MADATIEAPTSYNLTMLTGDIRNQIDQIWNAFWSGGVSNPLSVIEQITYTHRKSVFGFGSGVGRGGLGGRTPP